MPESLACPIEILIEARWVISVELTGTALSNYSVAS
jgi:hypothetical protein